ncbi:MAG: 16S rRNA (cytidine(1402)-2'-O)-methyltransferase [Alphaproteobacteria bacterium]|nr:16S rRNA (cytidine(1402)-2'-O)-methyltransferase [Alphaproteobacteria bacterium]
MSEGPEISPREGRSKSDAPLAGGLYLVATPIGNARDLTLRAIDVLKAADRLYAEDTRVTARLLAMHAIARPLHSYREHNAGSMDDRILRELEQGLSVALVSDAGTPLVSDPGQSLVERAAAAGCNVFPVPGASAVLAALTASGLPANRFFFAGFLSPKSNERRREIRDLENIPATLVLFEAPSRLVEMLHDLRAVLGDRQACVARELTKLHEDIRRCPLNALITHYEAQPQVRGEIVVLVAPPAAHEAATMTLDNEARLDARLLSVMQDHPVKEAAAIVAAEQGLPRRTVYARALVLKKADDGKA